MFRNIKYGIQNLIKWFPIIWKDRDWVHSYLMEILNFKLGEMAKLHRKYGHSVNSEELAKQLEECSFLAKKIADEEYDKEVEELLDSDLVKPTYNNLFKRDLTAAEKLYIRQFAELEDKLIERDIELLLKNMKKNLRHWWD